MSSDLVQRLRNLHAHSGDPDTVEEAALAIDSLESVCSSHLASIERMREYLDCAKQHIDRLEQICREQAAEVEEMRKDRQSAIAEADILREMVEERDRQLAEAVKVHMDFVQERAGAQAQKGVKLTDEQALRVLNAIREAGL